MISFTNGAQQVSRWIVLSSIPFSLLSCYEEDGIKNCLDLSFPNGYSNIGGDSFQDNDDSFILTFSSDFNGILKSSVTPHGSVESTEETVYSQTGFEVRKYKQVIMDFNDPGFNYSMYIYEGSLSDTMAMFWLALSDEEEQRIVNNLSGCVELLSKVQH